VFNRPYNIYGETIFNNCTFRGINYGYVKSSPGSNIIFNNITWDYSKSTYSKAFEKDLNSNVKFI